MTLTDYDAAVQQGFYRMRSGTPGPSPVAAFTITPATGAAGTVFTFDASGSTPGGDPLRCLWDFADTGPLIDGEVITHSYPIAGTYTVTLYVQDAYGKGASVKHDVVVT